MTVRRLVARALALSAGIALATAGVGVAAAFADGSAPGAPQTVSVSGGDGRLTVSAENVDDGGSPLTAVNFSCTSSDGGAPGSVLGVDPDLPQADVPLDNGHTYTCTANAENANGTGPDSVPSEPWIVGAPSFDAPSALIGDSSLFLIPGSDVLDYNAAITSYHGSCTSSDGGAPGSGTAANPVVPVSGLTNGKTYTCTMTATNARGTGPLTAVPSGSVSPVGGIPDPVILTALTGGDAQISVAFTAATPHGDPVLYYSAGCNSIDGGASNTVAGGTSPIVVDGLTNGKTYYCSVTATSIDGTSADVNPGGFVVPAGVPDAPSKPTVTRGDAQISVEFSAPADNGNAISTYTATCTSSDGGATGSNTGAATPIVVSGLTNGKTYTCTVAATNTVGAGPPSAPSATTIPATTPDAPSQPTVTRGNGSITVAFTAPSDGGSPAFLYLASCSSSDGGAGGANLATASPVVVSGLTNGKTYTCAVEAENVIGASAVSAPSEDVVPSVTPPAAPDAPTIGAATGGSLQIQVAFTASASNNGSTILGYTATCASSNGGASGNHSGSASPLTVTGLTNGKTYTCTVVGTNAIGDSNPSAASASVTLSTAPANTSAPTVTGNAIVQRTLTAHHGSWTGAPAATFTYHWQRCDATGRNCTNVAHATKATYPLTLADLDRRVRVVVTATNAGGASHKASAVVSLVRPVPVALGGPYFSNGTVVGFAGAGVVGTASRGSTVWTTTATGNVTGPHFAPHGGTLVGIPLARPIVGMQMTPSGKGYWLFAGDGGVFSFGDARFYGSTGTMKLNSQIIAMAATPTGHGYWLFAADGGVFSFGDAHFYGSTAGRHLTSPVVAMLATPSGRGYWIATADGRLFHFGDARAVGDVVTLHRTDIVGIVSTGRGIRLATKSLQLLAPA